MTEPLPVPLAPAVIVTHVALLVAVHPHPVDAVTAMLPVLAPGARFVDAGEMVDTHGMASCVTVNVLPPIVSVPVRGVVAVFVETL